MHNITARPQQNGLIASILLSVVLYSMYLLSPARKNIISQIQNIPLHALIDFMIFGIGAGLSIAIIRVFGAGAVKRALEGLLPEEQKNKLLPKAGKNGMIAVTLCVLIFMIFCEISAHTTMGSPEWYSSFKSLFMKV
jgi:hypothetical protein